MRNWNESSDNEILFLRKKKHQQYQNMDFFLLFNLKFPKASKNRVQ